MFRFNKNYSEIRVYFHESNNDSPFAESLIPIDNLPDTFEIDTSLNINDINWRVISATPKKKIEFRKTGSIKLSLTKEIIEYIDPKKILYSLPTINNSIPKIVSSNNLENVIVFHEDDWRQCEFLDASRKEIINGELQKIYNIYKNFQYNHGFTEIYIRNKIVFPLAESKLKVKKLNEYFTISIIYDGVAFKHAAAIVENSFALLTTSGWLLWGDINDHEEIASLNIYPTENASISKVNDDMNLFLKDNNLYFVDWMRLFWCSYEHNNFSEYQIKA